MSARVPVATTLARLAERALGAPLPVRLRAWDGSAAGPPGLVGWCGRCDWVAGSATADPGR